MGHVRVETFIKAPIDRCFDSHRDLGMHIRSTEATGERIVGEKHHGLLELGEEVTFEARHFGLRFRLTSKITEFDRPNRFVDEMQKGPFRSLRHVHSFEFVMEETRVVDDVYFELPLGALGRFTAEALVRRHLAKFLIARNSFLKRILEAE